MSAWVFGWHCSHQRLAGGLRIPTKVSDVRIMYGVWYWRDSHVVLIARLMHVPQLPGEGDAKGLRLPFQNGQSRASSGGCRRASEDSSSLLEI